jgi:hypothetical protein
MFGSVRIHCAVRTTAASITTDAMTAQASLARLFRDFVGVLLVVVVMTGCPFLKAGPDSPGGRVTGCLG